MALTALATVIGGKAPNGEKRDTLSAGKEVPKGYFSDDELKHYKEIGVVGEPTTVAQAEQQSSAALADRDARIAELEAQLAEAKAKSGTQTPAGSGSSGSSGQAPSSGGQGSSPAPKPSG